MHSSTLVCDRNSSARCGLVPKCALLGSKTSHSVRPRNMFTNKHGVPTVCRIHPAIRRLGQNQRLTVGHQESRNLPRFHMPLRANCVLVILHRVPPDTPIKALGLTRPLSFVGSFAIFPTAPSSGWTPLGRGSDGRFGLRRFRAKLTPTPFGTHRAFTHALPPSFGLRSVPFTVPPCFFPLPLK